MSKNQKFVVENKFQKPIILCIEPWATEYGMMPDEKFEIVTNDEALAKKAKHLTTQAKSDPFEYMHDEIGYNYRLVNVAAAMGVAQMEQLPGFIKRK